MSEAIEYVELRTHRNGNAFLMPDYVSTTMDVKYNEPGALEFLYPTRLAEALSLRDTAVVSATVGFKGGLASKVETYTINSTSEERLVDGEPVTTFSAVSALDLLNEAMVYPSNWPVTAPAGHEFVEMSIGNIFRTLMQRAKERGTLLDIDVSSFTGTHDSNGAIWSHLHSQKYENGKSYYSILQEFIDRGLVDAWVDSDLRLHLVNGGTRGRHVDIGEVEVRPAYNASDMTLATKSDESASAVLIEGTSGTALERVNLGFQNEIGRRRERFVSQGGIGDPGILTILADAELNTAARIPVEETVGLANTSSVVPFRDFHVADWIYVRYNTARAAEERRVRQIAISVSESREFSLGVTLGTILHEADVALARRVDAYIGGGGVYGAVANTGADSTVPNPPHTLGVSSAAYLTTQGATQAAFTASWIQPSTNVGGTAYTDAYGFEVQWRYSDLASEIWSPEYAVTDPVFHFSPADPGRWIEVRVRCVDESDHRSDWATRLHLLAFDAVPPPKPSAPYAASRLGAVSISWTGKTAEGADQPADFKFAEVHMGLAPNFSINPGDTATLVGTLTGAGSLILTDLMYNTTRYFRVVASDMSGNFSEPSEASNPVTVNSLVDTDFIEGTLSGSVLAPGTVTYKSLAVGDYDELIVDFSKEANRELPEFIPSNPALEWSVTPAGRAILTKFGMGALADTIVSQPISVTTGDEFWVNFESSVYNLDYLNNPVPSGMAGYVTCMVYDANMVLLSAQVNPPLNIPFNGHDMWTKTSGTIRIDVPNAAKAVFRVVFPQVASKPLVRGYVRDLSARRRNGGNLIVDGTITAAKIASLAINTGHLAANAVTATKIEVGAINASHIHLSMKGFAVNENPNFEEVTPHPTTGAPTNTPARWIIQPINANAASVSLSSTTSQQISGTRSADITAPAWSDYRLFYNAPTRIPTNGGDKWHVSALVRPTAGIPQSTTTYIEVFTHSALGHTNHLLNDYGQGGGHVSLPAGVATRIEMTFEAPPSAKSLTFALRMGPRDVAHHVIVDEFVVRPAVDDAMITDISPGKIVTGYLQGTVSVKAGAADYVEMRSNSIQGMGADGWRYFGFYGMNQKIATFGREYWPYLTIETTVDNTAIYFRNGRTDHPEWAGWHAGALAASYFHVDNEGLYSALRLTGPAHWRAAIWPYIDLRTSHTGLSSLFVHAHTVDFRSDTFKFTSLHESVDFRLYGTQTLSIMDPNSVTRLNLYATHAGQFTMRAQNAAGDANKMIFQSSGLTFVFGGHDALHMWPADNTRRPWLGVRGVTMGVHWDVGGISIRDYAGANFGPIAASNFNIGSDERLKENIEEVTGALSQIEKMKVYDYTLKDTNPSAGQRATEEGISEGDAALFGLSATDSTLGEYNPDLTDSTQHRGVLAHEVGEILPGAVSVREDGIQVVDLYSLISTAIAAVGELSAEVKMLKERIG